MRNATCLIMSSLRGDREEESREIKAVELVDLSPMAQRAPSDAIHQSAPRLSHLDWGPCGANPKCNQGLLPSAASGCWLHLPRTCAFVMPQLESQQHQPVASQHCRKCTTVCSLLSRNVNVPARSLCAITLYPSASSHRHPFVTADRRRAWKQTSHQANSNISCRVKGGLFAFDFGAVPRIEERNFRRPPVGHNSRELNRTSLLRQPVISWLRQLQH